MKRVRAHVHMYLPAGALVSASRPAAAVRPLHDRRTGQSPPAAHAMDHGYT